MNTLGQGSLIAFLDLVCCGFGAAVLMFLITITAEPPSREIPASKTVIVRCTHVAGPRMELGLEYLPPDYKTWQKAVPGESDNFFVFAAPSAEGSGAETVLVLSDPTPGLWQFRPYMADLPRNDPDGLTEVTLVFFGDSIVKTDEPKTVSLRSPAVPGEAYALTIRP